MLAASPGKVTWRAIYTQASPRSRSTWLSMQQSTGYAAYDPEEDSEENVEIIRQIEEYRRSANEGTDKKASTTPQSSRTVPKASGQRQDAKGVAPQTQAKNDDSDLRNRTDLRRLVSCFFCVQQLFVALVYVCMYIG
jgi:hypothetical protein